MYLLCEFYIKWKEQDEKGLLAKNQPVSQNWWWDISIVMLWCLHFDPSKNRPCRNIMSLPISTNRLLFENRTFLIILWFLDLPNSSNFHNYSQIFVLSHDFTLFRNLLVPSFNSLHVSCNKFITVCPPWVPETFLVWFLVSVKSL